MFVKNGKYKKNFLFPKPMVGLTSETPLATQLEKSDGTDKNEEEKDWKVE